MGMSVLCFLLAIKVILIIVIWFSHKSKNANFQMFLPFFTLLDLKIDKTRLYNFTKVKNDRRWLKVSKQTAVQNLFIYPFFHPFIHSIYCIHQSHPIPSISQSNHPYFIHTSYPFICSSIHSTIHAYIHSLSIHPSIHSLGPFPYFFIMNF